MFVRRLLLSFPLLLAIGSAACDEEPEHAESSETARVGDASDWCAEHALPESMCTKCNPELTAQFKEKGDWCKEHQLPESVCPQCNPMQPPPGAPRVGDASDWCKEHALPESMCTKCNPELTAKFKEKGDWCKEHSLPESVCPKCNPMQPPPSMAKAAAGSAIEPGTKIRFKSEKIEKATGIETVEAREAVVGEGVEATVRIELDKNNMADIRAPIPGVVERVLVDLGADVKKGQRLFVLESPRVGDLQGALSSSRQRVEAARQDFERAKKLHDEGIAPERRLETARRDLEVAEADQRAAESALRISGASSGSSSGQYVLRAPLAGSIVRRSATVGTYATEETSLATVADTSTMWAMLDVNEADAAPIREGQEATVTVDGLEGHSFTGDVTWVAPEVDPKTRTVRVRVEVANDEGLLRAHQFGRAVVKVDAGGAAVAVPQESVQRMGEESVVFVRIEPGLYEPKVVRLGRSEEDLVQVWGPVESGDEVVTGGAFLLKTELSRDSIGAGCCEVEPPSG